MRFKRSPKFNSIKRTEREFDSIDFILEQESSNIAIIRDSLYTINDDDHKFEYINLLKKGKVGTLSELNFIALILEFYLSTFKGLKSWNEYTYFEIDHSSIQKIKSNFLDKLRLFVDPSGDINYHKHPKLRGLYGQLGELEHELRESVIKISRSDKYGEALQFQEHDVINDRFVLAVKSSSYNNDLGPIIDRSSTGMTLFVEPRSLRDKSNKRIQILVEIDSIIAKIERDFTEFLAQYYNEIFLLKKYVLRIDMLLMKSSYIKQKELTRPTLENEFVVELKDFFHPLIDEPVTNSIEINDQKKGLIISGPNTGGKTVTLKAITICHLFMHLGLFVPARFARLHPVSGIYYFSSDFQDISEGLSSFASETKNYLSIFEELSESNLVVVDEIFNSTSSEEASALAIAFLEELHKNSKTKVLISTHHQVFKTFIHSNTQYISAHVGHDNKTFMPTYKLFTGEPGSSMAFHIFENISKSISKASSIPERASEILDAKQMTYEKLLQELSSKKSELDKILGENKTINHELKNQRKAMEGLLHLEKEKIVLKFKSNIDKKIRQAENLFDDIKSQKVESKKQLSKNIGILKSSALKEVQALKERDKELDYFDQELSAKEIVVGVKYYSIILDRKVDVVSLDLRKKVAHCSGGKLTVKCPFKTLRMLKNTPNKAIYNRPQEKVIINRTLKGKVELDCRGMRLDAFQTEVETSLIELINGEIPFLTVIHGHGTGVLKKWLRDHLGTFKEIKYSAEDGNDGSTKIELI